MKWLIYLKKRLTHIKIIAKKTKLKILHYLRLTAQMWTKSQMLKQQHGAGLGRHRAIGEFQSRGRSTARMLSKPVAILHLHK